MSILQTLFGGPTQKLVTLGSGGPVGYSSDPGIGLFGVIAPNNSLRNQQILRLISAGSFDFQLCVAGIRPSNFFTSLIVYDQTNTERVLTRASATFFQAADAFWTWGTGSNQVWTSSAFSPQRRVIIY